MLISLLLLPFILHAQQNNTLSLTKAYELAIQNYPLVKQRDLLKQTADININNLSKNFLPQFNISGQATYQSDVTQVKIPLPGVTITPPSKDQYKILADINQLIYDGGAVTEQKKILQLNDAAEQQKIEVELYKLKERVNQLYLGVLFLDEQLKQTDLIKKDINNGIKKTEALVNNGVAFRSSVNVLKAELLKAEQRTIEVKTSRKGLIDVLSLFINAPLAENVQLQKPVIEIEIPDNDIKRPEIKLFDTQEKLLNGQYKLIDARNKPKASAFLQSGYGKPGLNLFKNEFAFFYITGVRLNWNFGNLYTRKNDRQLIDINKKTIDVQKNMFLLNTSAALKQQLSEIDKLKQLINTDNEIIDLRIKVKVAAKAQLENAVITANDYLREINAEDQARQSLITHEVQLLQAQINYQTILGKQ
ncbi:MAG: TolC family protein [Chitinophagaceae bacterium]|nr:TolC family protein [Chitinophagaceae bacterium]